MPKVLEIYLKVKSQNCLVFQWKLMGKGAECQRQGKEDVKYWQME